MLNLYKMKPSRNSKSQTTDTGKSIRDSLHVGSFRTSVSGPSNKQETPNLNPLHVPSSASSQNSVAAGSSTLLPGASSLAAPSSTPSATKRTSSAGLNAPDQTNRNSSSTNTPSMRNAKTMTVIHPPTASGGPSGASKPGPGNNDTTAHSRTKSTAEHSEHGEAAGGRTARTKSIVVYNNKPVAMFMESKQDAHDVTNASEAPPESATNQATTEAKEEVKEAEHGAENFETPEKGKPKGRGLRTYRIWNPNQERKSILVKVGSEEDNNEAEKIFKSSQMRHKSYHEWHKQAKATLPSNTGGPPIEDIADVIDIAPALKKEEDPRSLQKTIRRLSIEGDKDKNNSSSNLRKPSDKPDPHSRPKHPSVKTDYTRFRVIEWKENEKSKKVPVTESQPESPPVENKKEETIPITPAVQPTPLPPTPATQTKPVSAPLPTIETKSPPPPPPIQTKPPPVVVVPSENATPSTSQATKKVSSDSDDSDATKSDASSTSSSSSSSSSSNFLPSTKKSMPASFVINVSDDEEERKADMERKRAGQEIKEKIKTMRELAEHIPKKREMRHKLVESATGFTTLDTEQIPLKEHLLYLIEEIGSVLHDVLDKFVIWKKPIREINGRYGVVISSYFVWLRQMVALEVFAFIVSLSIIIIPQVMEDQVDPPEYVRTRKFQFRDLINGEGSFHHTYLYYSGYKARDSPGNPFSPAFRFVFCILFMFLVLTYFIFSRLTRYYQSIRMESKVSGVAHMEHFKTIVCGWDSSCRDPQAKFFLHKTIRREMYILARASEQKEGGGNAVVQLDMEHKKYLAMAVKRLGPFWGSWTVHIIASILIVLTCFVQAAILVLLCILKFEYYKACVDLRDDDKDYDTLHHSIMCPSGPTGTDSLKWILEVPALFVSVTTLLLTRFIVMVGDYETWNSPERKIYASMIRAGLFYFTNLGVFYSFWISQKRKLKGAGFSAETIFGKELYRLVVIQGLTEVVLNIGVKGVHYLCNRRKRGFKRTEFRTEYSSLNMFFMHSISRIGTLFCPPLSFFVTMRLLLDFYQNRFALFYLSSQESYSAHASHVYAPFLLTFFILCYLITSFMNVYYISETKPSEFNGPFVEYNRSYDEVLREILEGEKGISWLAYLAHPGFLFLLNVTLGALVYFCRYWSRVYEPIIVHLNKLIGQEREDREAILRFIFDIGNFTASSVVGDSRKSKMRRSAMQLLATDISSATNQGEDGIRKSKRYIEGHDTEFTGQKRHSFERQSSSTSKNRLAVEDIDAHIDQVIHTIHTRRLSVNTNQPIQEIHVNSFHKPIQKAQPNTGVPPGATIQPPAGSKSVSIRAGEPTVGQLKPTEGVAVGAPVPPKAPVREVDYKAIDEKLKAQKLQEEQDKKKRAETMMSILGNIVDKRRNIDAKKQSLAKIPSQVHKSQKKTNPKKKRPANLTEQIDQLSIAKTTGAVNKSKTKPETKKPTSKKK